MKGSRGGQPSDGEVRSFKDEIDTFHIPSNYTWVDAYEKKRRIKAKGRKGKRQTAIKSTDVGMMIWKNNHGKDIGLYSWPVFFARKGKYGAII